jgi:outer membrane protein TolC
VPDNRLDVIPDPTDPFRFTTRTNGYFADPYWNWEFNVGFQLRWTLFNGFRRHQQAQQTRIALEKARISRDFLEQSIATEVVRALRDVQAARRRMISQEQNVQRAALNYDHAEARLKEGVATPIEVREASSQLDQSRLNYLQAIHDYLVARSAYETAIGTPVSAATAP